MKNNKHLPFVCPVTTGVPILLCPAEIASAWEAIAPPSNGRVFTTSLYGPDGPHTDYARACDAAYSQLVSNISVGSGSALVLGGENPSVCWLQSEDFAGGYLVTWLYTKADDFPDYKDLIDTLPEEFFQETGCSIYATEAGFYLFESVIGPLDGEDFELGAVKIQCPPGNYKTTIGFYETDDTEIKIVRIKHQIQDNSRLGIEPREIDLTPIVSRPYTETEEREISTFFQKLRAENAKDPEIVALLQRLAQRQGD